MHSSANAKGPISDRIRKQLAESGYRTIPEVAEHLRVSTGTVRMLIRGNALTSGRHAGRIVVPYDSMINYCAAMLRIGSVA